MVIAALAICASIPGLVMYSIGAWPVVGFMGLDVAAVWWALSASTRSGERAEHVALYPDALEIRQVAPGGAETLFSFNPFFTRLVVERDDDRVTGLLLQSRERSLALGSFLNPADKASFARAFGAALARARG